MKTLYITDLDGTFLHDDATLSVKSQNTINSLIEKGLLFTVATARSLPCAKHIIKRLNLKIPAAFFNGALIYDFQKNEYVSQYLIDSQACRKILEIYAKANHHPYMYTLTGSDLSIEYKELYSKTDEDFYNERIKLFKGINKVDKYSKEKKVVFFNAFESFEKLNPIYQELLKVKGIKSVLYRDIYSGLWLCETLSDKAGKKSATEFIKNYISAESVVAFGDNANDIPMIMFADIGVAVENATEELKSCANKIIGSNNSDAVSNYICEKWNEHE